MAGKQGLNYLVTGAARGIGKGLVQTYLNRPQSTVVAVVRSLEHPNTSALHDLPRAEGTKLITIKIDGSVSDKDTPPAIHSLTQAPHNLDHLDIVVANAGWADTWGDDSKFDKVTATALRQHWEVNTLAPIMLLQSCIPLLKKSQDPKFISCSSRAGSITELGLVPLSVNPYGSAKAALNYLTRSAHVEQTWLTAVPINPGNVGTDMGNEGAQKMGRGQAAIELQQGIDNIVTLIDAAKRDTHGGKFMGYDNKTEFAW